MQQKRYGSIPEAVKTYGLGRTTIYRKLKDRELSARKCGRRTLLDFDELEKHIANLPLYQPEA